MRANAWRPRSNSPHGSASQYGRYTILSVKVSLNMPGLALVSIFPMVHSVVSLKLRR